MEQNVCHRFPLYKFPRSFPSIGDQTKTINVEILTKENKKETMEVKLGKIGVQFGFKQMRHSQGEKREKKMKEK